MAEYVFPFASVDGDRMYSDTDFALFYNTIFTNGIVATVSDKLRVEQLEYAAMRVKIMPGAILIQGRQYLLTEPIELSITPGSSTADRSDSIVAQLNMLERTIKLVYKQGSTVLIRNENIWEMQLARIVVPKNATAIYNAYIKDTRSDATLCGYSIMNGELDVLGVEQQYQSLLQQYFELFKTSANDNEADLQQLLTDQQATFQTWLTSLQSQLDSNQAGNLQNQLNDLKPTEDSFTMVHNLGFYPNVQLLFWKYGLGTVPLEGQPDDINWDGEAPRSIPFAIRYDSRNEFTISVPTIYKMNNPVVRILGINDFLLNEGIYSMEVRLITEGNYTVLDSQIVQLTREQYDAMQIKDNKTLYVII